MEVHRLLLPDVAAVLHAFDAAVQRRVVRQPAAAALEGGQHAVDALHKGCAAPAGEAVEHRRRHHHQEACQNLDTSVSST